jgi:hypothetical protein
VSIFIYLNLNYIHPLQDGRKSAKGGGEKKIIAPTSRTLNRAFALDIAPFIVIFLSEDEVERVAPVALPSAFPGRGLFVSWASSWAKRSSRIPSSCVIGVALAAGDALDFFNFPIKNGGMCSRLSDGPGRRLSCCCLCLCLLVEDGMNDGMNEKGERALLSFSIFVLRRRRHCSWGHGCV